MQPLCGSAVTFTPSKSHARQLFVPPGSTYVSDECDLFNCRERCHLMAITALIIALNAGWCEEILAERAHFHQSYLHRKAGKKCYSLTL